MTVMSNSNSSHQAGSLTHAEAIARTQAIDLSSYHLHLDVSGAQDNLTFPVTSRITFSTQEPGSSWTTSASRLRGSLCRART